MNAATAAQRISNLNQTDPAELVARTTDALNQLVDILNRETTLLRAGHFRQAGELAAQKTQTAQDYVQLARTVQREAVRLKAQVPELLSQLRQRHESLATQMAENLRVLATAKSVTEDILSDVARSVGGAGQPETYGTSGKLGKEAGPSPAGFALNRAL